MKTLLSPVFAALALLAASQPLNAEEFKVPPAAVAGEELSAVRDRLTTGLFFRGELADSIMEAGLQDKFPGAAGLATRSETRAALMEWIRSDPEKAANLYFYLKDRGAAGPNAPAVIDATPAVWSLRRHFLDMAGLAAKAAADKGMTDEELSLAAQRLFGPELAAPEEYAPLIPEGSAPSAAESGPAPEIKYADFLLHPERVDKESQALEGWLNSVKKLLESERAADAGDEARTARLLGETFVLYRNFTVVLSNLKGLARINASDAARIEALRREFRRDLTGLEALAAMRRLDRLSSGLPGTAPATTGLRAQAARLKRDLETLLPENGGEQDPGRLSRRLYELESRADSWTFRAFVYQKLAASGTAGPGPTCVFDRLMRRYLSRFFPASGYARSAEALQAVAGSINADLEDAAGGAAEPPAADLRILLERTMELDRLTSGLKSYSRLNARLQFIFWDALANPLGLKAGPEGITAGTHL